MYELMFLEMCFLFKVLPAYATFVQFHAGMCRGVSLNVERPLEQFPTYVALVLLCVGRRCVALGSAAVVHSWSFVSLLIDELVDGDEHIVVVVATVVLVVAAVIVTIVVLVVLRRQSVIGCGYWISHTEGIDVDHGENSRATTHRTETVEGVVRCP